MPTRKQAVAGPRVPPPRHKMALLTWPSAWALITLILWLLGPIMATWPLPLRTLVLSVLMVVGLTWLVIPYLTRIFAGWLAPTPPAANPGDGMRQAAAASSCASTSGPLSGPRCPGRATAGRKAASLAIDRLAWAVSRL